MQLTNLEMKREHFSKYFEITKKTTSIQLTFILSIKFLKDLIESKQHIFFAFTNDAYNLSSYWGGTKHIYDPSQEFKKKSFLLSCQNINQAIAM